MKIIKAISGVILDSIKIIFDRVCLVLLIIFIIGMCGLSLAIVMSVLDLILGSMGVGI